MEILKHKAIFIPVLLLFSSTRLYSQGDNSTDTASTVSSPTSSTSSPSPTTTQLPPQLMEVGEDSVERRYAARYCDGASYNKIYTLIPNGRITEAVYQALGSFDVDVLSCKSSRKKRQTSMGIMESGELIQELALPAQTVSELIWSDPPTTKDLLMRRLNVPLDDYDTGISIRDNCSQDELLASGITRPACAYESKVYIRPVSRNGINDVYTSIIRTTTDDRVPPGAEATAEGLIDDLVAALETLQSMPPQTAAQRQESDTPVYSANILLLIDSSMRHRFYNLPHMTFASNVRVGLCGYDSNIDVSDADHTDFENLQASPTATIMTDATVSADQNHAMMTDVTPSVSQNATAATNATVPAGENVVITPSVTLTAVETMDNTMMLQPTATPAATPPPTQEIPDRAEIEFYIDEQTMYPTPCVGALRIKNATIETYHLNLNTNRWNSWFYPFQIGGPGALRGENVKLTRTESPDPELLRGFIQASNIEISFNNSEIDYALDDTVSPFLLLATRLTLKNTDFRISSRESTAIDAWFSDQNTNFENVHFISHGDKTPAVYTATITRGPMHLRVKNTRYTGPFREQYKLFNNVISADSNGNDASESTGPRCGVIRETTGKIIYDDGTTCPETLTPPPTSPTTTSDLPAKEVCFTYPVSQPTPANSKAASITAPSILVTLLGFALRFR